VPGCRVCVPHPQGIVFRFRFRFRLLPGIESGALARTLCTRATPAGFTCRRSAASISPFLFTGGTCGHFAAIFVWFILKNISIYLFLKKFSEIICEIRFFLKKTTPSSRP
jgi:hypothetical protein